MGVERNVIMHAQQGSQYLDPDATTQGAQTALVTNSAVLSSTSPSDSTPISSITIRLIYTPTFHITQPRTPDMTIRNPRESVTRIQSPQISGEFDKQYQVPTRDICQKQAFYDSVSRGWGRTS